MVRRPGGDGFPPDNSAEKNPQPEVGQVYKLNRKYSKGFDFVKIENITPAEKDKKGKARIQLAKWNSEKHQWVEAAFSRKMLLETFLEKNDQHNYIFSYHSEDDFYTKENIDISQRLKVFTPEEFEEAGAEKFSPQEKDENGNDAPLKGPEDELVLGPDQEEKESEAIPGRITGSDFAQAYENYEKSRAAGEQIIGADFDAFFLEQYGFQEGDEVTFFDGKHQNKGRIDKDGNGNFIIYDPKSGISWRIHNILNQDSGYIQKRGDNDTGDTEKPAEPESLTPEPETLASEPQPEAQENQEEGGTGLQEHPFADYERQKEVLEQILAEARLQFVQDDYEYTTQTNKLTKFFRLNSGIIPPRESAHALEYGTALKNLRDYEFGHLQSTLDTLSVPERKEAIESFLLKYRYQEPIELHSLGKEVQSGAENENLWDKVKTPLKELGNGYRKLSFKKKIALTVGVVGLGAVSGAGLAVAGVATAAYAIKRAAAGAAGYLATDEGLNKFLSSRAQKKAEKESGELARNMVTNEAIYRAEEKAAGREAVSWEKLLQVTDEKLKDVNKDLEKLKIRESRIKIAAFAAAIGLPATAHVLGLFEWGGGTDDASGVTATPLESPKVPSAIQESPGGGVPAGEAPEKGGGSVPGGGETSTAEAGAPASAEAGPLQASVGTEGSSFEAVTVEKGDNLWNLVQKQLPDNITDEAEKNRITASIQNSIQNKLSGLTDAEIKEKYGFSSKSISLIKEGEVIKLDTLVSKDELQEIINGKTVFPEGTPDAPGGAVGEISDKVKIADSVPPAEMTPTPNVPEPEPVRSQTIGFKDTPLSPEEQRIIDVRNKQLNFTDADEVHPEGYESNQGYFQNASYTPEESSVQPENVSEQYTYEMSRYQDLEAEHRPLWRENMTFLRNELLDINNTEFGPDYHPGNWKSDELWALYKGDRVQDLIATDNPRFERDPRDYSRAWQERQIGRRGIIFESTNPYPQLDDGPDARAIHTMDKVEQGYRNNIRDMAYSAIEKWGSVALPGGKTETVQQYMTRIATLYTRERLQNPDFRLNF